jgi:serine/threonine protein kinase/Tol biopolymer transport system component
MTLTAGDLLHDRYRIGDIIGKGGMGAVYRGEDTVLQVMVAIKENLNPLPQAVRQFKREALLLASLRHSNLPRVTDHFIQGDLQYLIMDYVPGNDMKTILENEGALPESRVMPWIKEITDALTYLHSQHPPVIHRDIKPANIKITPEGKPVLVDFGIAKASEAGGVTTTGARSLTPGFAPPEQYGSSPTDARSDEYSLAATLYNLLSGRIPTDSLEQTLGQEILKPLSELVPGINPALAQAIQKAMSLSPSERFQTVQVFYDTLEGKIPFASSTAPATATVSRAPRTVVRRTPEKETEEKLPSKAPPEMEPLPARTPFRLSIPLVGIIGGLLCLAVTGIAIGGYALSGVLPSSHASPSSSKVSPTADMTTASISPAGSIAPPLSTTEIAVPSATLTPTVLRTPTPEATPTGGSRLMAFVSNRIGDRNQIYTYNLATKETRQLTLDSIPKGRLIWTRDGQKIIYEAGAVGGRELYIMNADGTSQVNLTNSDGDDYYPAISPAGNLLAFVSNRNGTTQIYWMNLDGSNLVNVSAMHSSEAMKRPPEWDPAWSPDGQYLYLILQVTGPVRVYRWNTQMTSADPAMVTMADGTYIEAEPAVSPNGDYVAYTEYLEGGSEICLAPTDLSKRRACNSPLTDKSGNSDADWSPDGQWLAYTRFYGGDKEIYIIMISGAKKTDLTNNPAYDQYPAWQPDVSFP